MSIEQLTVFLHQAFRDHRVTKSHLCVLVAIIDMSVESGGSRSFYITRRRIMAASKIAGLATYHKCVTDLSDWGYFIYSPSYHPAKGSMITFCF